MKRHLTATLAAAFAVALIAVPAMADPFSVFHNQTTLGEELILDDETASPTSELATRTFRITNLTGVTWTDYHLRVSSQTDPIVIFNESLADGTDNNAFSQVMFSPDATEVWFLGGTVAPGAEFIAPLVLWDDGNPDNLGPFDVLGTPSVVPTPGALPVGLIGMAMLAMRRRR